MARKRGGLAGIWDRNKGIIKAVAPVALGMIPGVGVPLAAAAGAAMGGLDRPGKGGIGLDVGGALKGGVTGYLGGQTGKGIAGGVKSLLAPKTPDISGTLAKTSGMLDEANAQILSRPAYGGAPTNFVQVTGGGMPAAEIEAMRQSARGAAGQMGNIPRPMNVAPQLTMSQEVVAPKPISLPKNFDNLMTAGRFPSKDNGGGDRKDNGGDRIQRLLSGFRENKDLIEMAGKGIQQGLAMGRVSPTEEANMMKAETERMAFEDEKAQREARQRALQQYFMPLLGQIQQERQGMSFGPMYRG